MESYFRVSADATDTDKRVRREYMRFVWRKRRAYLPGFVFSLVILFVIAPVSAFLAAGRGGYELLFVGIACLLYMLLLPNIASSMLGRGRRAAGAVYDFTSDSVVLHGGGGEEEATSYSDITEIVELPRMFVLFAGGKRAATVSKEAFISGEAEAFAAFISVRCGRGITAFSDRRGRRAVLAVGAILLAAVITVCAGVLGIKYAGRGYANSEGSVQVRASAEERNLI